MPSMITDRLYGESSGMAVKAPVVAISQGANLALTGLLNLGGYSLQEGDRVLVKDQTDPIQNGVYNASASGWARSGDFDGAYDVVNGTLVTTILPNGKSIFYQLNAQNPVVIGSSALNFTAFYIGPLATYPITPEEILLGISPSNTGYPALNPFRYGADGTGGAPDAAALATIRNVQYDGSGNNLIAGVNGWQNGMEVAGFAQTYKEYVNGITPVDYRYPPGQTLRYGSDPLGVKDSATAYQNALTANGVAFEYYPGTYRIDGTITIGQQQELRLGRNVTLRRMSAFSASTAPVVHVKNSYATLDGGIIQSDNASPFGVVRCGHADLATSNWNALWWRVRNVDVICRQVSPYPTLSITGITKANPGVVTVSGSAPPNGTLIQINGVGGMTQVNGNTYIVAGASGSTFQLTGNGLTSSGNIDTTGFGTYTSGGTVQQYPLQGECIGVWVPSSQPQLGPTSVNYYGRIENVHVQNATTPFWLTDEANGHTLINCTWNGMFWNGLVLQGAYGNTALLGFCDGAQQNGVFCIRLMARAAPAAPHASSTSTSRNCVTGGTFEPGTTGNYGVYIDQNDNGVYALTNNHIEFRFNSASSVPISDAGGLNTIICDDSAAVFQNGLSFSGATPTSTNVNQVSLGNTTSTSATSGSASALPATPAGYWTIDFGGFKRKMALYLP